MFRLLFVLFVSLLPLRAWAFDHSKLDALLKAHVSAGKVDYEGLRAKKPELDAYLASVASASGEQAEGFYINAYNAVVLGALLSQPALPAKVTDLGGFFDAKKYKVAGKDQTLNEVETYLRDKYKDPRLHFALNCGARSCPPLIARAFPEDPAALSKLLDELTFAFMNGPGVKVDDTKKEVAVTRLMEWYAADFGDAGAFVRAKVTDATKSAAVKAGLDGGYKITFQFYNWEPNKK